MEREFPEGFLWGAAISAHQVEGNNFYNDWWADEQKGIFKTPSGLACNHYALYKQDFDLARSLGHNCLRISVEWSRLEPQEGNFNLSELQHYIQVVKALRERGIQPVVTLHHFTNPLWFNELGSWQKKKNIRYFLRFVQKIVQALCKEVSCWITINEPMVYVYEAYLSGIWPPHKKGVFNAHSATRGLLSAHVKAYRLIHQIYSSYKLKRPLVSIAKNIRYFSPCRNNLATRLAVALRDWWFNIMFLEAAYKNKSLDFIGVNYYTRENVSVCSLSLRNIFLQTCQQEHKELTRNSLGWYIYPRGLYELLLRLKKFNLPVFITENGICTDDDAQRWDFIREQLIYLHQAIEDGVKVMGYLYWSLLDNFEWDKGFDPRFGIVEVDYASFKRTIRPSGFKYAQVCRTSRL